MASSGSLLKGKTCLVTGASRGMGSAIAEAFAEQGAALILAARSTDSLHEVKRGFSVPGERGGACRNRWASILNHGWLHGAPIDRAPPHQPPSAPSAAAPAGGGAVQGGGGGRLRVSPCDLSDRASLDALAAKYAGSVDVLVSNAGVSKGSSDILEGAPPALPRCSALNRAPRPLHCPGPPPGLSRLHVRPCGAPRRLLLLRAGELARMRPPT